MSSYKDLIAKEKREAFAEPSPPLPIALALQIRQIFLVPQFDGFFAREANELVA
jgi:hypothetical protein